MDVDRPGIATMAPTPDPIEQLLSGIRSTRVRGQDCQEAVLLGPQVDANAIPPELLAGQIEREPSRRVRTTRDLAGGDPGTLG